MIDSIRRHPILAAISASFLLFLIVASFPIVPETKEAVIVRFGKPVRILNEYQPGRPIGAAGAGISWRIPFAEEIVWIDKRVQDVDMQRQQVLSTDQRRLEVDAFARYRIVNPLLMYVRARTEAQLTDQLRPILGSEVRNELGKVSFAALLTPERQGIMEDVRSSLNKIAGQYGVEIIDVRIKRTDLPSGRRKAGAVHPRPGGCGRREDLCRKLRDGPGLLRFLPGHAVLPDDISGRRDGETGAHHRYPVAGQ